MVLSPSEWSPNGQTYFKGTTLYIYAPRSLIMLIHDNYTSEFLRICVRWKYVLANILCICSNRTCCVGILVYVVCSSVSFHHCWQNVHNTAVRTCIQSSLLFMVSFRLSHMQLVLNEQNRVHKNCFWNAVCILFICTYYKIAHHIRLHDRLLYFSADWSVSIIYTVPFSSFVSRPGIGRRYEIVFMCRFTNKLWVRISAD
jgi:hypothetical protein